MRRLPSKFYKFSWGGIAIIVAVTIGWFLNRNYDTSEAPPANSGGGNNLPQQPGGGNRPEKRRSPRPTVQTGRKLDLGALHQSLDQPDRSLARNACGKLLRDSLKDSGDYSSATQFLSSLPEADSKLLLRDWVLGIESPLGSIDDFRAQQWMVSRLGFSQDRQLTDRLYRLSGGRAFLDLVPDRDFQRKETRNFECAAAGSVEINGVAKTIGALTSFAEDEQSIPAVKRSMTKLLAGNAYEASAAIGNLPVGKPKDILIESLVIWMKDKGEVASLDDWISQISDSALRAKLSPPRDAGKAQLPTAK